MTRKPFLMIAAVGASAWLPVAAQAQAGGQKPGSIQDQAPPAAGSAIVVKAGSGEAAQQLTLFCDIENEACAHLVVVLGQVIETHPGQVGVRFRHMVTGGHTQSPVAYRSALAAARQGRGWDLLDMACANRDRLDDTGLRSMAVQLGLDVQRFVADIAAAEVTQVLEDDAREAKAANLESVPALFLNGSRLPDSFTYDAIVKALVGG